MKNYLSLSKKIYLNEIDKKFKNQKILIDKICSKENIKPNLQEKPEPTDNTPKQKPKKKIKVKNRNDQNKPKGGSGFLSKL